MYQSLLLSMLNIVLHLFVLVQQLNQQKFQYKWHDVFHSCDCRGHRFDFYRALFRCEHSSAPCHITNKEISMFTILRTVHSVRYIQNYSFSICTCTTLSYYEQGRYSVVFIIYCFTANIPFRLLLMNMQIHVPKWRVVTHYTHLPTNIPPAQYTYFTVFIYLCQEA